MSDPHIHDIVILDEFPIATVAALASRAERFAFWLNAYNRLVRRAIAHWKPAHSVWDVPRFFERAACRVGPFRLSADDIEHGILRGNRRSPLAAAPPFGPDDSRQAFGLAVDPRVHFALNCGARSCPAVRDWNATSLDADLDEAVRTFLTHAVSLKGEVLSIPEVFRWFAVDFAEFPGGVPGFLAHYLPDGPARRALVKHGGTIVEFVEWDWRLPVGM